MWIADRGTRLRVVRIGKYVVLLSFWLVAFPFLAQGQMLIEKPFRLESAAEVELDLVAAAPNTSWGTQGREAAVVTVSIDGHYQQDIMLFAGSETFTYPVTLGSLRPGEHTLRIDFNRKFSAPGASTATIQAAEISVIDRSRETYPALAHSPILYARRNTIGRFSDTPLLMWYETTRNGEVTAIRYSVIFTNEDGGTETNALMARWGRATDIEWVYEVKLDAQGKVVEATFQEVGHGTRPFRGDLEGTHPLLLVASDNNNFADKGRSEMRFALRPIPFDLSRHSREEVMDRHPWTYRIMAEELHREGKIGESSRIGQHMADPRNYLYLEAAAEPRGAALSFAVKLRGDRQWYTSDLGIGYFRIDRSGYFRTTIRLPAGATLDRIERIVVRCDLAGDIRSRDVASRLPEAACTLTTVNKIFLLDKDFLPGPSLAVNVQLLKLRFGDMIEVY